MTTPSLIRAELQQFVGYETVPQTIEIDKSMIRRFVEAVGDPNPLWQDEAKDHLSRYDGIVAPPSLVCAVLLTGTDRPLDVVEHLLPSRILDGGAEWEVVRPIRLGEIITVVNRLADLTERQGRYGPMLMVSWEATWRDERQEVVARALSTTIHY